jgi:hypothetical protein
MAYLTIFTAPKAFTDPLIGSIQRNAVRSWVALGGDVQVILIGDEPGLREAARETGVIHLPGVRRNERGTPLVSSIFELAREHDRTPFLSYVNADILLFDDFVAAIRTAAECNTPFVLVGQRWDLDVPDSLDFEHGWQERLRKRVLSAGHLHPAGGSDYFAFPRDCYEEVPSFAIGRAGWDNWMIYHARKRRWAVIDASPSIMVIHQRHDYGHLPGGRPHYRLPESDWNVQLAGGRRTIFSLRDSTHLLVDGRVQPRRFGWPELVRKFETYPILELGSPALAQAAFALVHPVRAFGELRGWVAARVKRILSH